jgi:hypothetical protein
MQDEMHCGINALLAKEDFLFRDPFTDNPWEHPKIPRCAYPVEPVFEYPKRVCANEKRWADERVELVTPLRPKETPLSRETPLPRETLLPRENPLPDETPLPEKKFPYLRKFLYLKKLP